MPSLNKGQTVPGDDNGETEYNVVLRFDSDDPEFCRGFEAGVLWGRLSERPYLEEVVSGENSEMAMRIAEAKDLPFSATEFSEDWFTIRIGTEDVDG